uniref:Uncharacterized protein n=1 Tax=Arundo donax TaxID=35708 RepID=A0A0A9EWH3_ARUDO
MIFAGLLGISCLLLLYKVVYPC